MEKFKHTPGPWSVPHFAQPEVGCQCTYVLSSGYCGCIATIAIGNGIGSIADGDNDSPPLEEARANARLIAAAPDMLEAAIGILPFINTPRCNELHHPKKWQHETGEPCPVESEAQRAAQHLRAAIDKAIGRTP